MDEQHWNEMYLSRERVWSGEPNGVLVTEAAALPPGRALDVGCGEGADALWLARRGWQVTATDISQIALARAAEASAASGLASEVTWTHADLLTATPPAGGFDLVSMQYFPVPRQHHHTGLRALIETVATGGTFLVANHDLADMSRHPDHSPDLSDYCQPGEITALLDDSWTVLVDETRPRVSPAPAGTHHIRDTVLLARRRR